MLRHSHRVLLVEDDPQVREAIETLLLVEGYRVVTANEGQEALERLRDGFEPCVILLDLMMPVKDGWQFRAEQVRDPHLARIPVVVCSGTDAVAQAAAALGIADHVQKPISVDALLDVIGRHCVAH
jgi:CheY-like chemotaxis protein